MRFQEETKIVRKIVKKIACVNMALESSLWFQIIFLFNLILQIKHQYKCLCMSGGLWECLLGDTSLVTAMSQEEEQIEIDSDMQDDPYAKLDPNNIALQGN